MCVLNLYACKTISTFARVEELVVVVREGEENDMCAALWKQSYVNAKSRSTTSPHSVHIVSPVAKSVMMVVINGLQFMHEVMVVRQLRQWMLQD